MIETGKHVWKYFLDMLFPSRCIFTKKEGLYISSGYRIKIQKEIQPPDIDLDGLGLCVAGFSYHNIYIKKIVEYFKFHGFLGVGKEMVDLMAEKISLENSNDIIFVPVPLHWTRLLWRGFNQSYVLAKALESRYEGARVICALERIKKTKQQAVLKKEERIKNVEDVFCVKKNTSFDDTKTYIVVDDVMATGSTLKEALKVLRKEGVKKRKALVFARSL